MEDFRGKEREKEEVYSKAIKAGKRTYFMDVKETKAGDLYLTITESKRMFDENLNTLSGSFDVRLTNGEETLTFSLNRSYYGLYIPAGWWRTMDNFSTNSFTLVLASTPYDAEDYIRNFEQYTAWKKTQN